jgi:flagellar basal body P-ring formation protein FlgA
MQAVSFSAVEERIMASHSIVKQFLAFCTGILLLTGSALSHAEAMPNTDQTQNLTSIRKKVEEFLTVQTAGYPGRVTVTAGAIDNNLKLAKCPVLEVFMPQGSRAWGKTNVGVRCNAPAWTIYMQATVNVVGQYLVAAAPLAQGRVVDSGDLLFESGDLAQLPPGIFTDPEQAIGRIVNISMNAGTVLRQEMLKASPVVQQGQTVTLITRGKGFSISAEGHALNHATDGQLVRVKVANGQVVSGIARNGGKIEVSF